MQVALFHPGTQHSRQTAFALQQLGRLAFFATGLFPPDEAHLRLLPGPLGSRLRERLRSFGDDRLDPALVHAWPRYELPERLLARLGAPGAAARFDRFANDRLGGRVAAMAAQRPDCALWGFDNSALGAFSDPQATGHVRILDRTIADWREWNRIAGSIADTHGDWLPAHVRMAPDWLIERSDAEYAAADVILCPAPFVRETILRHSGVEGLERRMVDLPYCFDARHFAPLPAIAVPPAASPVRFLFVGQLSARKGLQHVLEAFDLLPEGSASLTCIGPRVVPDAVLGRWRDRVDFRASMPRALLAAAMREHDVLLLPSYFEGSAIVLLEALASGLAVIATRQAGLGPTAASGITLERPDTQALAAAMERLAADRELLLSMRRHAPLDAANYDENAYRARIAVMLGDLPA